MAYHFRNLVFEGGGVKGIAYVGALQVLEEKGILPTITRVGGTSAGAINAVLVGLNFTPQETLRILNKLDFNKFMDDDLGALRDTRRLLNEFGWHKGDFFREWISDLIKKKTGNPDATFADVQAQKDPKGFRDMFFMGTNLSTHFAEVFSFERTPRICVADAVRISMSIPLFFASHRSPRGIFMWTAGCWTTIRSNFLTDSATWVPTIWRPMGLKRITTQSITESLNVKN